jgi:dethiobiotin synthetase
MAGRGVDLAGVVLGSWPAEPGLAERCNLRDLETLAARPLAGALPERAGLLDPPEFLAAARSGLSPAFGGRFDAADFHREYDPMPDPPRRTQP